MIGKRREINDLLNAIIAEGEVALRKANFEEQIKHIRRLVTVIENRINRWEDEQRWSELDRLFEKAERAEPFWLSGLEEEK